MLNKRGAAEWFWIVIGMIVALAVAIFLLVMFFDFGASIRTSFDKTLDLADTDDIDIGEDLSGAGDSNDETNPTSYSVVKFTAKRLLPTIAL
jgi:hypothetical protein